MNLPWNCADENSTSNDIHHKIVADGWWMMDTRFLRSLLIQSQKLRHDVTTQIDIVFCDVFLVMRSGVSSIVLVGWCRCHDAPPRNPYSLVRLSDSEFGGGFRGIFCAKNIANGQLARICPSITPWICFLVSSQVRIVSLWLCLPVLTTRVEL